MLVYKNPLPEPVIPFSPKKYICHRAEEPVEINGIVDKKVWAHAPWTEDFIDISGGIQTLPRLKTRAKMLWDEQYLYIAAELEETQLWATLTERESWLFTENDFEVFIDPDGDSHHYYEFEINPLGTTWDLMLTKPYRDGGIPVSGWDMEGLKTAVRCDGTVNDPRTGAAGWRCEMALPFKILKECAPQARPPKPQERWRINFLRVQWDLCVVNGQYRKEIDPKTGSPFSPHYWAWSPQGLSNMHYPEMWGYVQFSDLPPGKHEAPVTRDDNELIRWHLRSVYYKERNYYAAHGRFTSDVTLLNVAPLHIEGYDGKLLVQNTDNLFEASMPTIGGEARLYIRDNGRIWSE